MDQAKQRENCHDCGAKPGALHAAGCDEERCPCCRGQSISCFCHGHPHPGWEHEEEGWFPPDALRVPWSGIMYEEEAEIAVRDGRYVRWGPSWIPCASTAPGAKPDLNYGGTRTVRQCPHGA